MDRAGILQNEVLDSLIRLRNKSAEKPDYNNDNEHGGMGNVVLTLDPIYNTDRFMTRLTVLSASLHSRRK